MEREQAIDIAIELWEWLAETGSAFKRLWPGWEKYDHMANRCPLCEFTVPGIEDGAMEPRIHCKARCPYYQKFRFCHAIRKPYGRWCDADSDKARKYWAAKFLEQLKELKNG